MPIALSIPMNDLSRGISRDRNRLLAAMNSVLDSGHVVMGPNHDKLQAALAEYWGTGHVLGVGSGTDALELSIKAVMPSDKHVVLTAANAGGYTSTATSRAGYQVAYADVSEDSLCLTEETVAAALTDDVGVVVVTHLYGNLTDIRGLVATCHSAGVQVIEDWAQSIGARRADIPHGIIGDIAATSFYPTKNLGAIGDGGAITTNDSGLAQRISQLRQYGWSAKYHVDLAGGANSRLDEIQAAFLLARLPLLDELNDRRRSIITRYAAAASGGPLRVLPADGLHHAAHLAVARTTQRPTVRDQLARSGIATDIHFPVPDYAQPGFTTTAFNLPVTERATNEVLSLPCFPEMTDSEVDAVCNAIGAL